MKSRKIAYVIGSVLVTLAASSYANTGETLFKSADPAAGKTLHSENNCAACHQQRTGGNEQAFYIRAERKIATPEKLIAQVSACSAQLKLGLFPEDELNIAAYLNREYYKFK
jgi:cytochrome c peroxidase